MWPHSQALALARQAGLEALLALAGRRVEACSAAAAAGGSAAGGSAAGGSAAAAEAQAALGAVAGEVEALRRCNAYAARPGAVKGLQLAAQAQRIGLQGAKEEALRLLRALSELSQPLHDGSATAGKLAAAAEAFSGCEAFGAALQELVQRCAAQQPAACLALVQACSQQQELQHRLAAAAAARWLDHQGAGKHLREVVQLALAVPTQPDLQGHLAAAAAAAVKQDASGQLARRCLPLIQELAAQPQLQAPLVDAATEALLAAAAANALTCVALALEVPQQPQVQQRLVAAAVEGLSANPAAVLQQVAPLVEQVACLAQQPELQGQLAAAVGGALVSAGAVPNAHACISLATALPAGDLQNSLVAAVSAGFRSWGSHVVLRCETCLALLGLLGQLPPHLQAHLAGALADALLRSDATVAAQSDPGLLMLSDMLLGSPELAASHYSRFASGVASRAGSAGLVTRLLDSHRVRAALELPGVQRLVEAQVANLQALAAAPQFSWHMPQAELPGSPEVRSWALLDARLPPRASAADCCPCRAAAVTDHCAQSPP
jgi:hypothetical protein